MRREAFTLIQAAALFAVLVGLAAILFPVFGRARKTGHGSCQSNLKQMGLGVKQYVQDYDEKFPPVSSRKQGWVDLLQPYIKSTRLFQCPSVDVVDPKVATDYYFNSRLAGVAEASLNRIGNTIMNGEGLPRAGTNANLSEIPFEWRSDHNSPLWRHLEGANYSYADGHVKWSKPESITTEPATKSNSTFAIG